MSKHVRLKLGSKSLTIHWEAAASISKSLIIEEIGDL